MKYFMIAGLLFFWIACAEKKKEAVKADDIYYTCSMHPQIMQNAPGKCPICGMILIAVKKSEGKSKGEIILSDQQIELGGIRVDTIGNHFIGDKMVLTATLAIDESKSVSVNARIAGRVEKLYVKSTGDYLHKGDHLYDLYSEELNNAKQEYLLALDKQKFLDHSIINFKQLVESSRNKLLLWGMSENQIAGLVKTQNYKTVTSYFSPSDGYISMLQTREGDYVAEGAPILRLADLSTIWAEAQVYVTQLSQVDRLGKAVVQFPDLSKEINGRIDFVNPEMNPDTRINLIRVSIPNPGGLLKPGMPAYVVLKNRKTNSLTLPADAVIRNENGDLVWILVGHNTYKSIMVKTGLEDGERIEITNGLKPGDVVVTRGAYLLNSEYIIKHGSGPMAGHDMNHM